jgi:hypothetical protein
LYSPGEFIALLVPMAEFFRGFSEKGLSSAGFAGMIEE